METGDWKLGTGNRDRSPRTRHLRHGRRPRMLSLLPDSKGKGARAAYFVGAVTGSVMLYFVSALLSVWAFAMRAFASAIALGIFAFVSL